MGASAAAPRQWPSQTATQNQPAALKAQREQSIEGEGGGKGRQEVSSGSSQTAPFEEIAEIAAARPPADIEPAACARCTAVQDSTVARYSTARDRRGGLPVAIAGTGRDP